MLFIPIIALCLHLRCESLIIKVGGGLELKDGYYMPFTVAGCGKETKG